VPLWLVFTTVHGPTSFNEDNVTLGLGMHAWGLLLGVIPNVLVGSGLLLARRALLAGGGVAAKLGFGLLLAGISRPPASTCSRERLRHRSCSRSSPLDFSSWRSHRASAAGLPGRSCSSSGCCSLSPSSGR
jgi:hypothetical protein